MPLPLLQKSNRLPMPVLQLLFLDRRFAIVIALVALGGLAALILPAKLIRVTPRSFQPPVRVSAVDLIQARMLCGNALKAERAGNFPLAAQCWQAAFQNNPADPEILRGQVASLLRAGQPRPEERALRIAMLGTLWHPADVTMIETLCRAAAANRAWELILNEGSRAGASTPAMRGAVVRARFYTEDFAGARAALKEWPEPPTSMTPYRCALDWLADAGGSAGLGELRRLFGDPEVRAEAQEACLLAAAARGDLAEYESALKAYRQTASRTMPFELLHVRLLLNQGFRARARDAAVHLPSPTTGREVAAAGETLHSLGFFAEAKALLGQFCPRFPEGDRHWLLYASLLVAGDERGELAKLAIALDGQDGGPALGAIAAAARQYVLPGPRNASELRARLGDLGSANPGVRYFAAEVLAASGQAAEATATLAAMEPDRRHDAFFYAKLFVAAAAARDEPLMKRAAARRLQLAPDDLVALKNQVAMQILFEEQPEETVRLSALCLAAEPDSNAAIINHAAALLNAGYVGPADLLLARLDQDRLEPAERDQWRFLRLKRAVQSGDFEAAHELAARLERANLFERQTEWIRNFEDSASFAAARRPAGNPGTKSSAVF